ncbi:MAG TPA: signal recognition particle receptor subunit alpha, partial [Gammaproteobacteria bacterium]|nr:signal recognition particle receptor subunit alpha [Gammaproteobacteria bacterium]
MAHSTVEKKSGFFSRLRGRLNSGNSFLTRDMGELLPGGQIDEDTLDELETRLLLADVGVEATREIIDALAGKVKRRELQDIDALLAALGAIMTDILEPCAQPLTIAPDKAPFVLLVVGVNGAGKTTTIGKLAAQFQQQKHSVMLAAADTFRAAAVEQLQAWGERNRVPVIA